MKVPLVEVQNSGEEAISCAVCGDCAQFIANGETPIYSDSGDYATETDTARWIARFIQRSCGGYYSWGTTDHVDGCDWEEVGDCDCDDMGFDWQSCDGCGSTLGGDRYGVTLWKQVSA